MNITLDIFTSWIQTEISYIFPCLWAGICSFILGFERQRREKFAGIRTHLIVSLGACAFTLASVKLGQAANGDQSRIAAQIVSGIGFLGGGVIMRDSNRITGLTTASTIWVSSAIGVLCASHMYLLAMSVSLLTILFLFIGREVSHLVKTGLYNWVIELDIVPNDISIGELKDKLIDSLEKKELKIVHCASDSGGHIRFTLNEKASAGELSKIVKSVIPEHTEYNMKVFSKKKDSLEEEFHADY